MKGDPGHTTVSLRQQAPPPRSVVYRIEGTEYGNVKLLFFDLVNEFNTGNRNLCIVEALKPEHGPHSLFDSSMILFNGLITNDKFCFVRTSPITLRWAPRPRRNSPQAALAEKRYLPETPQSRGGAYEAPVAKPPSLSGNHRGNTTLGPGVSTPAGVGAVVGSQHRRSAPRSAARL